MEKEPGEDAVSSLKKGQDEGQTWGRFCHFKTWEAEPENKWGYRDSVRNLGRAMPAISISESRAGAVCNVFRWACSGELRSQCSPCALQQLGPFVLESFGDVKSVWGS